MKKQSDVQILSKLVLNEHDENVFITWLNHSSLLANAKSFETLQEFDYIGVDGMFLKSIMNYNGTRSSADLFLPSLLTTKSFKVILVGGQIHDISIRQLAFEKRFPLATVCEFIDGYNDEILKRILLASRRYAPDLIIIGMGAPKQEDLCVQLKRSLPAGQGITTFTCGGWLNQIAYKNYYPKWAYPLKLNWLVRLVREPRRLWRRYTLEPIILICNLSLIAKFKKLKSKD